MDRRNLLKTIGLASQAGLLSQILPNRFAYGADEEPHFFLHVFIVGGMDASCLFDAREKKFTAANKIQNYFKTDVKKWVGPKGGSCWTQNSTDPLIPFANDFSIINGVIMNTSFEGHEQNALMTFTGNQFGGKSMIPLIGEGQSSLSYLQIGSTMFDDKISNLSNGIGIDSDGMNALVSAINAKSVGSPAEDDLISQFFAQFGSKFKPNTTALRSSISAIRGMAGSDSLVKQIRKITLPPDNLSIGERDIRSMMEFAKAGIAKSFLYSPPFSREISLDTHAPIEAAQNPGYYMMIGEKIAEIFKVLKQSMFSRDKSFLDVTTVMISSEFGRTMRQLGLPIDATGSDHNALGNSIIIGGKGIKCGYVFGGTDLDDLEGAEFAKIPSYHRGLDSALVKPMGKPIDFGTGFPLQTDLTNFNPEKKIFPDIRSQFINMSNIGNTLLDMFGIKNEDVYWDLDRNMPKAKKLAFLRVPT